MLRLYKDTKIYILAPAYVATWWVELLHQLAFKIEKVLWFKNVFIQYLWIQENKNPTPKDYEKYKIHSIENIDDNEHNVLIVPEVFVNELSKYNHIRKVVWRLSVDNYYFSKSVNFFYRVFNYHVLLKILNNQNHYLGFSNNVKDIEYHRVQCEYIRDHLIKKWIHSNKIAFLSDYLISDFFENQWEVKDKENIVCYNPKKWLKYTRKIIEYMKKDNIAFIPIQNMTRNEVIELLQKAKVYIDFWHFPWKDRIPREASVLWCSIIISTKWAWWFYEDFPLSDNQKINNLRNLSIIREQILYNIEHYEEVVKEMESYRNIVRKEESKFDEDLWKIFTWY